MVRMYLYRMWIVSNPMIKAVRVAQISSEGSLEEPMVRMLAPKMIGIDIKNENFRAVFSFNPERRPDDIVAPERDIPGKSARICAKPIVNAFL